MRSNWPCWKAQEKFQVEFRFCKTTACSYVTLLTTYLAKKKKNTMFKVSNRYTRKRCLLISKITLKISERRHLTTSYFSGSNCPETCLGQFFLEYISIWNQVPRPVISTIVEPYMLWEIRNHFRNIWFIKIQNISIFLVLKKQPQKPTNFSTFYLIFKRPPF